VVSAKPTELALAGVDLVVEFIDQAQAGLKGALPRLRQSQPGEQLAATNAEEVGDRAGLAVRKQDRVDALLQAGAVADEVQPPARAFALCAHLRVGQPDRGHEIATRKLRQHPGVDPVGLAGKRRESLHLLRVGDLDLPADALELVVDEARSVHRLDRRTDRRAMAIKPFRQSAQTIRIRRGRTDLDRRTISAEQMEVETLAAEIQTGVQH
jgi:hypothetical protein